MTKPTDIAPRPQTTRAILISGGFSRPTPTIHFWKETRLIEVARPKDKGGGPAYEHVFECFKTGHRRRWGLDYADEQAEVDL